MALSHFLFKALQKVLGGEDVPQTGHRELLKGKAPVAAPVEHTEVEAGPLDVELVRRTWRAAVPTADTATFFAVGDLLFDRIFEVAPGAIAMFPFSDDPAERKGSSIYKKHAAGVVGKVEQAVALLENLEVLVPDLESLGKRHGTYGVESAHYDVVGGAFLWTLEAALSPQGLWDETVEAQWTAVWGVVASTMKKGQCLA